MTPEQSAVLRATPSSTSGIAQRLAPIAEAAGQEPLLAVITLKDLTCMGLVESHRVPRDTLYCRTAEGDRQVGGGR